MTPFPPSPFSSGVTPATQALAFTETQCRFPRKGVTVVPGRSPLHILDLSPPWGGPTEATNG